MRIGNIDIKDPVILAPMSGVTDKPFRKLVRSFGAPFLVTEMIASRAMIIKTRQSLQKCEIDQEGGLTSVQLAGNDPEVMAEAAKMNEDMGAKIIDINFGCPVKKVVNGFAGSALMKDEILAAKILKATVDAVNIPVTLKMRTGWNQQNRNAPKLAKIAEDLGIQMLTVHGRTRCQLYRGSADWEFIQKVKDSVKIPLVVNGDIKSAADAKQALRDSGANGVMIGRGCYGKPWLISQIVDEFNGRAVKEIDIDTIFNAMLEHFEENLSYYGVESGLRMSRKHLAWYTCGMKDSAAFRQAVNLAPNKETVIKKIAELRSKQFD